MDDVIKSGRDYFISDEKPLAMSDYMPYTCPHPLAGAGTCNNDVSGTNGYSISQFDTIAPEAPVGLSVN